MPSPALLSVDLNALARNFHTLEAVTGAPVHPVVKADAYGCGIEPVTTALAAGGCKTFFVAQIAEARQLRDTVSDAAIYVTNGIPSGAAPLFAEINAQPVIGNLAELAEWDAFRKSSNWEGGAALHFDTGMNRLGFRLSETSVVRRMCDEVGYAPQMIMSHLACADQPLHEKNRTQLALFTSVIAQFPGIPASLANSAGTMSSRDTHFQMVRPGIALYGGRAVNGRRNPMLPAVTLDAFLAGQTNANAVRLEAGDDAHALLPHLGQLALIEVSFPSYRDGRGYSAARILREAGYTGELRAAGDVLVDQFPFMRRCGFDSFAPEAEIDAAALTRALERYKDHYQPAADNAVPVWKKRHG